MNYKKLCIILSFLAVLSTSCTKGHYDVSNVHSINAEGEMLLPLVTKSFTMMDLMQSLNIDSIISCSEEGTLSYNYHFEHMGAIKGSDLLKFNDLDYHESISFENPFPFVLPQAIDTTISIEQTVTFDAEHINVMEAMMRSGRLDFNVESNIGQLRRIRLHSSSIKHVTGDELSLVFEEDNFGFDLGGLLYESETGNTLNLAYDLTFHFTGTIDPELYFNVDIEGRDLAIQEMTGHVETYDSWNRIDTTFNFFPDNVSGSLEIHGAHFRLSERNDFGVSARLKVDTALVSGQGIEPFSVLYPLPLTVDLTPQSDFVEAFDETINGKISTMGGRIYASSVFTVNPAGMQSLVSLSDNSTIDVLVDVDVPFSFVVDDVHYLDTIDMQFSEIDMPDFIEKLTMELTFNSTIPLNLFGEFYLYNSQIDRITDTLFSESKLIAASYDGEPALTTVSVEVSDERLENLLHSDRIIMRYVLDTEAHHVALKADQKLDMYVKAKVKYNGDVEFNND